MDRLDRIEQRPGQTLSLTAALQARQEKQTNKDNATGYPVIYRWTKDGYAVARK